MQNRPSRTILLSTLIVGTLSCGSPSEKNSPPDDSGPIASDSATAPEPAGEPTMEPTSEPATEPPESDCELIHGNGEPLVTVNDCNTLSYGLYAAHEESPIHNRIPDYSFAGYMGGGVAIPDVPVVLTLDPEPGDNHARIQGAIDTIASMTPDVNGYRGALLLRAGSYELSQGLSISKSGIVLRGEGQGEEGTILHDTLDTQHHSIVISGNGNGIGEVVDTRVEITTDVAVGSVRIPVESTTGFEVGDQIGVQRTPNQAWIDGLGMAEYGWTPTAFTITHERRISAIDANVLEVDVPIVDAMKVSHGGGVVFKAEIGGRIEKVGVEHLRLVSSHVGDTDENHGWIAIQLKRTVNGWVRNVTTLHYGYAAVSIESESNFNTVQEVAYLEPKSQITGSRRYAFNLSDGFGNLFQRCYSEFARHDFVSGARTTGPNVWVDCYSESSSNDDGPHHRWATGLLFDNVSSYQLHVENREDSGTGHGWSGAQTLFWNSRASRDVICDTPKWAMNWSIGTVGPHADGSWAPDEPDCWWESPDNPVEPRSIYLKQLEARLGIEAVRNVTIAPQRQGRIWSQLSQWRGSGSLEGFETASDPNCDSGIVNGNVCCASSCGSCGGSGCGSRPGGAESCCVGTITDAGNSCNNNLPPCLIGAAEPSFEPIGESGD